MPKYWNYLTQTGSCCDLFTFIIFSEPLVHIDFFPQSFHLSQYLRLHVPKAGKSNFEDFIWGKLQEGAGSAITNIIAVAKVEAKILHTWRWSSLWWHCSSVAMLVKSHLRRPDREVRNHLSFADPRALSPRTNSFSHFYLCLHMLSLFKASYGLRENLLFKHSWEMTKIYDVLCPKFPNGELPRPQSLTAHEMKLRMNNKD